MLFLLLPILFLTSNAIKATLTLEEEQKLTAAFSKIIRENEEKTQKLVSSFIEKIREKNAFLREADFLNICNELQAPKHLQFYYLMDRTLNWSYLEIELISSFPEIQQEDIKRLKDSFYNSACGILRKNIDLLDSQNLNCMRNSVVCLLDSFQNIDNGNPVAKKIAIGTFLLRYETILKLIQLKIFHFSL